MTGGADLVAVVEKPATEDAVAGLRDAGVYDDDRRIREHGPDAVAVPVTDRAGAESVAAVAAVVEDVAPERRRRGLADLLRDRGWTDDEVDRAPGSWAVIGDVVLAAFDDCPRRAEVGEALLDLHRETDTVLARRGIAGDHREPDVEVVAGSGDTETVHVEHGTRYALDLREVMFSPGNKAERVRMGDAVDSGERVLDMFAGIGYFALPMARAGAAVTAVERNPAAFRYLVENAALNGVEDCLSPVIADCRDVAGPDVAADRVVMGHYDALDYLDAAFAAVDPGGVVHVHATVPEPELPDRPVARAEAAAADADRDVAALDRRTVKSYSEGVLHVVLDVRLD